MTRKPEEKPQDRTKLGGNAKSVLRDYFERIERLNEEIEALNADKSEIYQEAKANGLDVKVMRIVLSRRQMDQAEVQERDALVDLYESVIRGLGDSSGTKSATRARAKDGAFGDKRMEAGDE